MHKSNSILTAVLFLVCFCIFVIGYEKFAVNRAFVRINTHARIIKDAMWSYNRCGIEEYLKLAALSDRYESVALIDQDKEVFYEIHQTPFTCIDQWLISLHLIPGVPLQATVSYHGEYIGQVQAVWRPGNVYAYANMFLALALAYAVILLHVRLVHSKRNLEKRVIERTTEFETANRELKREIFERTRIEKALRTSEMKYRFLSENITDVIWTLDMDLNFTYISPVAFRLRGWDEAYRKTLTLPMTLTRASFRNARGLIDKYLAQCKETGDYSITMTGEFEVVKKDGTSVVNEVTASFVVDDNNCPTGMLGVSRDITHRRRAEFEKLELLQKLERSKKMESLGLLAGGVAHDLNNVLSGIVTYPDLLLMDLSPDSPMYLPVQTIKESGKKAAAIVEDLLTLARRGVNVNEVVNINDILRELQRSTEYNELFLQYPDVRLSFDPADFLPNTQGSPVHLNKTFMNLITNAAEAQSGGGKIYVSTRKRYLEHAVKGYNTVEVGQYVHVQVKDFGQGISEKDINHIFEPFYTKKKMGRSGSGLGLAVVWGTVEDHKGYIDVCSESGKGTTFDLYFPVSIDPIRQKDAPFNLREIQGNGERILVVDDQKPVRTIASALLQRLNYSTHAAESGEAAVEYLKDHTVDLVILDMNMDPGMDGLETWQNIVGIHPDMRAIIASGYAETGKVKAAQRIGAGEFLKKPYMIESLGKAIKKALVN